MEQLGCSPAEFHLLCCISSWAVCTIRPRKTGVTENQDDHGLGEMRV